MTDQDLIQVSFPFTPSLRKHLEKITQVEVTQVIKVLPNVCIGPLEEVQEHPHSRHGTPERDKFNRVYCPPELSPCSTESWKEVSRGGHIHMNEKIC